MSFTKIDEKAIKTNLKEGVNMAVVFLKNLGFDTSEANHWFLPDWIDLAWPVKKADLHTWFATYNVNPNTGEKIAWSNLDSEKNFVYCFLWNEFNSFIFEEDDNVPELFDFKDKYACSRTKTKNCISTLAPNYLRLSECFCYSHIAILSPFKLDNQIISEFANDQSLASNPVASAAFVINYWRNEPFIKSNYVAEFKRSFTKFIKYFSKPSKML